MKKTNNQISEHILILNQINSSLESLIELDLIEHTRSAIEKCRDLYNRQMEAFGKVSDISDYVLIFVDNFEIIDRRKTHDDIVVGNLHLYDGCVSINDGDVIGYFDVDYLESKSTKLKVFNVCPECDGEGYVLECNESHTQRSGTSEMVTCECENKPLNY